MEVSRELRDPLLLNVTYIELGDIELCAGNLAEAQAISTNNASSAFQGLGQQAFVSHELESFAFIAQAKTSRSARRVCWAQPRRCARGSGPRSLGSSASKRNTKRAVAWLHTQLDEAAYRAHLV